MSSKSKQQKGSRPAPKPTHKQNPQRSAAANKNQPKQVKHHRSTILTVLLVIMALHGIFAAILYSTARMDAAVMQVDRPWIITMMIIHELLNIVAAGAIFYWKKWGLYVYAASTILAVVAGLLSIGMWSVFYMILPLVILGWVLRDYWGNFE